VPILAACSRLGTVTYIPDGGSYTSEDLEGLLASADLGRTAETPVNEAVALRQEALADLRQYGDEAADLADALTSDFPADLPAVPITVELGMFEGAPAWFVTEAAADADGTLTYRRLWVLSRSDRSVIAALASE
jgi:hypothetical protein